MHTLETKIQLCRLLSAVTSLQRSWEYVYKIRPQMWGCHTVQSISTSWICSPIYKKANKIKKTTDYCMSFFLEWNYKLGWIPIGCLISRTVILFCFFSVSSSFMSCPRPVSHLLQSYCFRPFWAGISISNIFSLQKLTQWILLAVLNLN